MKKRAQRSGSIEITSIDGKRIITPRKRKRIIHRKTPAREKLVVVCKDSGNKTCVIITHNGKIFLGDDVWRLENKADCCEYPVKQISLYDLENNYDRLDVVYQWTVNDQRIRKEVYYAVP
ncbi:MAG: hypothetical protein K2K56_09975 [Lachnospiraceae bacterium]|nr:hypothetical protein [Lachnospiraceae bacterium]